MSATNLGCAQNADGTLKDASEIEFTHSHSPSLVNLLNDPVPRLVPEAASVTLPKKRKGKELRAGGGPKPKRVRPITSAIAPPPERNSLTYYDQNLILDFCEGEGRGWSQRAIVNHFQKHFPGLSQSSISRYRRDAQFIHSKRENPSELTYKRQRHLKFPELDDALIGWFLQAQAKNVRISGGVLRAKAEEFAIKLGIPEAERLALSNSWLDCFKQRHGIREYKFYGEASSVPLDAIANARVAILMELSKFAPDDRLNVDETCVYY